jgi:hypothetical protein
VVGQSSAEDILDGIDIVSRIIAFGVFRVHGACSQPLCSNLFVFCLSLEL